MRQRRIIQRACRTAHSAQCGGTLVQSFQDLVVWQKSMSLAEQVYRVTETFPRKEIFGLQSQLRRAAVSVPSNVAEGKGRSSDKEFILFLCHARGSLNELKTQILLCGRLGLLANETTQQVVDQSDEVGRVLNGLINALDKSARKC
ncbi:MAG: four helix bundle protein [Acidobacteriales bacterium]|nr:four helix bundle protein [Terriglobales bacterium]